MPAETGFVRILAYSAAHGEFFEAGTAGGDFPFEKGMGLSVYAQVPGPLIVASAGEEGSYTLLPGTNHLGLLTVPGGYRAFDLLLSLGLGKVQSVRRFDSSTGLWQTASVRDGETGTEMVGSNFEVNSGDGLVVTVKERLDGWKP
jgi:hypothetical protein